MNYMELDKKLKMLTKSEFRNKTDSVISEKYSKMQLLNYKGKNVYLFNENDMIAGENISISKHSRFSEVPMHIHTYIEFSYVYSGKITESINDKSITLTKGQICIVDTSIPHSIFTTDEDDIIINILMRKEYFSTSFLSRLSSNGILSEFLVNAISDKKEHDNYIIFNCEKNKKIPNHIKELLCEYFDKSLCSDQIIDCYIILIFSELLRIFHYESNQSNIKSSNNTTIIDILHYLENNYMTCTLTSTADNFNYHPNYLSSLIKKSTNKSFKELILLQRLTRSSILLENTNMTIYEIANEIGYKNLNFFYKKFREHFGVTPNELRGNFISNYRKEL